MSRLTRDGTAEPVSRDQILRHERGQGNIHFPCSAYHEQDWQPYPVDPYSCYMCDHTYIHIYILYTILRPDEKWGLKNGDFSCQRLPFFSPYIALDIVLDTALDILDVDGLTYYNRLLSFPVDVVSFALLTPVKDIFPSTIFNSMNAAIYRHCIQ